MTTLSREPRIHPVPITALRPTQITVGMREVKANLSMIQIVFVRATLAFVLTVPAAFGGM